MTEREVENVILLSIDALRADHLSCHGYERETSPNLDRIASEGAHFTNAFSASSHTREAVPAMLTGLYPSEAIHEDGSLAANTLATHLSEEFATAAFHSNPYISRAYGFDRDFDHFYDDLVLGGNKLVALAQRAIDKFLLKRGRYHARASEINRRSLSWIDSLGGEPFFLWNHYMDVHGPYNPPEEYDVYPERTVSDSEAQSLYQKLTSDPEAVTPSERKLAIDLYDGEIRYVDAMVGGFLDSLQECGLLGSSLIVITADHGDAFGEHGYYTHPRYLDDELLHVPLIVCGGGTPRTSFEAPVSSLDIVATFLDVAGLAVSVRGSTLRTFWNETADEHPGRIFSSANGEDDDSNLRRFAVRNASWKCTLEQDIDDGSIVSESVYAAPPDGSSLAELKSADTPERAHELLESLRSYCNDRSRASSSLQGRQVRTPDEIEDRLEALGYR